MPSFRQVNVIQSEELKGLGSPEMLRFVLCSWVVQRGLLILETRRGGGFGPC